MLFLVLGKFIFFFFELIDEILKGKGISRIYKRLDIVFIFLKMGKNLNL